MSPFRSALVAVATVAIATSPAARADIYRWDTGEVISGTEGIEPGPGVQLQQRSMRYASLPGIDLTLADFFASDLEYADLRASILRNARLENTWLESSMLTNADFTDSLIAGANLSRTDLTKAQLYSSDSYKRRDLSRLALRFMTLIDWDLSGQDLTGASFNLSDVTRTNFTDAIVAGANFSGATQSGLTKEQLYSTASYRRHNLQSIDLADNDLSGWDFSNQDLTNGRFTPAIVGPVALNLTQTNFVDAIIEGAQFRSSVQYGFTKDQLYSTASYKQHNTRGIDLGYNDLTHWDFREQDLTNANFNGSTLTNADLADAGLLYSTFTNANLSSANLARTFVYAANFAFANLSFADLRGTFGGGSDMTGAISRNAILRDGTIAGLDLAAGDQLVVRNYRICGNCSEPIPVTIQDHLILADGGDLQLQFDAANWDSLISFEPSIPVELGGTLELMFDDDVDVATQIGRTFHIFDWTGVEPIGAFSVLSPYPWDVSELYATGQVTLLLPGDTNGDQAVDIDDLKNVRNNFGGIGLGDTNNDGSVDLTDLNNVRNFFGVSTPQVVPESSGVALAGVGLLALAFAHATHFRVRGHQRIDLLNQDVKSYSTN